MLTGLGTRIKLLTQPWRGRSAARNAGLAAATGDLIALLDSDDLLLPGSIECRAAFLEQHPAYDIAFGRVVRIDALDRPLGPFRRKQDFPSGWIFGDLARNNMLPPIAYMFRRDCVKTVGGFNEELHLLEDYDFFLRLSVTHSFAFVNREVAAYRIHAGNTINAQTELINRAAINIQSPIFDLPEFERLSPKVRAEVYCSHGTKYASIGETQCAGHYYRKAIYTDPFSLRALALLLVNTLVGKKRFRKVDSFAQKRRRHTKHTSVVKPSQNN